MSDETDIQEGLALLEDKDPMFETRRKLAIIAEATGEWAGFPAPMEGEELVIEKSYPWAHIFREEEKPDPSGRKVRNVFHSCRHHADIVVFQTPDGKIGWGWREAFHGFALELRTMGCSSAWGIEQEARALLLLAGMLRHGQFKKYLLTGMFIEKSKRSGLTYCFRKLRPTVVLHEHEGEMKVLCCLCMHPIGFYARSWAGAMCPTDDVVAHLTMMRGDEPMLWRRSNQHPAHRPEAGL